MLRTWWWHAFILCRTHVRPSTHWSESPKRPTRSLRSPLLLVCRRPRRIHRCQRKSHSAVHRLAAQWHRSRQYQLKRSVASNCFKRRLGSHELGCTIHIFGWFHRRHHGRPSNSKASQVDAANGFGAPSQYQAVECLRFTAGHRTIRSLLRSTSRYRSGRLRTRWHHAGQRRHNIDVHNASRSVDGDTGYMLVGDGLWQWLNDKRCTGFTRHGEIH